MDVDAFRRQLVDELAQLVRRSIKGFNSVSCEPMWQSTPLISM
jgi:hypothetical protein